MHDCAAAVTASSSKPMCCCTAARPAGYGAYQAAIHSWCSSEPKHLHSKSSIAKASQGSAHDCMLHGIAHADAVRLFAVYTQSRQHEYDAWCTANNVVQWAKANHDKVHSGAQRYLQTALLLMCELSVLYSHLVERMVVLSVMTLIKHLQSHTLVRPRVKKGKACGLQ